MTVSTANQREKPESSPYPTNGAVNQAKPNVNIIFKLSIVEGSISLNVIALTVGDRGSKK